MTSRRPFKSATLKVYSPSSPKSEVSSEEGSSTEGEKPLPTKLLTSDTNLLTQESRTAGSNTVDPQSPLSAYRTNELVARTERGR